MNTSKTKIIEPKILAALPQGWEGECHPSGKGYTLLITKCPPVLTDDLKARFTSRRGRINTIPMLQEAKRIRRAKKREIVRTLKVRPTSTIFSEDCEDLSRIGTNGATIVLD